MTTAKKSPAKKSPAKKSASKAPAKQTAAEGNHCWPGFEPTPGKMAGTQGSCKPKPGRKSAALKKADSKAAAASKLEKQGKPNPKKK